MVLTSPRIGVLGGTFDPVHIAHLIIAEEVREKLKLEKVLFIPTGEPWLKANRPITAAVHRVEMLRLALASNPHFELSLLEVERGGPSYTVDTMEELRRQQEQAEFFFILGQDALRDLPLWKQPARLIQLCRLVGIPRPKSPPLDLSLLEAAIPGITERVILLEAPLIDISATEIRQRAARGQSLRYLVPAAVEEYIRRQRLYGHQGERQ
jgi:nicotinate-nucleotide adenylyltransferase